jgi:hypothetical protein
MKKNCAIFQGKPQVTSLARTIAFNGPEPTEYSEIVENYKLSSELVYNSDGSRLTAVHNPPEVIAVRGS